MRRRHGWCWAVAAAAGALVGGLWGAAAEAPAGLDPAGMITGGVLVRGGRQTSCNVVAVGQAAVFVAANCLDLDGSGRPRATTADAVAVQVAGRATPQWQALDPSRVRVHGQYDPRSLANNIAIVRLDAPWVPTVATHIALASSVGAGPVTYRRALLDDTLGAWAPPLAHTAPGSLPECLASPLFAKNPGMLACSGTQIPVLSVNGSDFRDISYGTGTAGEGPQMLILSLYSHSQAVGSGNGSRRGRQDARMLHYYTAVSNYARFASDFLGSSVTVTDAATGELLTNYTQIASPVPAAPGVVVVGGDVFGPDNAVSTTTEATSTATATSATAPESHSASDEAALGGRRGLSAGAIAGIAIAAAVVVAAVAAVATRYALVARRRRCAEAYWDREIAKVQSARSLPPMSPALDDTSVDPQK